MCGLPDEIEAAAVARFQTRSVSVGFSRIGDFQSQQKPTAFQAVVV
jgi:hypothetical protein